MEAQFPQKGREQDSLQDVCLRQGQVPAQQHKDGADKEQLVPDPQHIRAQEEAEDPFRVRDRGPVGVDPGIDHVRRQQRVAHHHDGGQVPLLGERPGVPGHHGKPDGMVLEGEPRNKVRDSHSEDHRRTHDDHVPGADISGDRHKADSHEPGRNQGQIAQERPVDESCQYKPQRQKAIPGEPLFQNEQDKAGERHQRRGKQLQRDAAADPDSACERTVRHTCRTRPGCRSRQRWPAPRCSARRCRCGTHGRRRDTP